MLRILGPVILIVAAIGIIFGLTMPQVDLISGLAAEAREIDRTLANTKELKALRDNLSARYFSFSQADIQKLSKALPDTPQEVRLIVDLEQLAKQDGLKLINAGVTRDNVEESSLGGDSYNVSRLRLSLFGPYASFRRFLEHLESSLRVVDIISLSFIANDDSVNKYDIELLAYWAK